MRYQIDLLQQAIRDLDQLPLRVRRFTLAQLENLAEEPTLLSERSDLPYPLDGQFCWFDYDFDGETWIIRVLFDYSEDEWRLVIHTISHERRVVD